ncbi:MAG: hypothetical protein AAGJ28_05985 [Pseudomonadota bacterium]
MMIPRKLARPIPICPLILTAMVVSAPPANAETAETYARCAGVADSVFDFDLKAGDAELLDDIANEAHIFMVLARKEGTNSAASLHIQRRDSHRAISTGKLSGDDVQTELQACSDLREALERRGAFTE